MEKKKRNKISSPGQVPLGTSDHAVWEIRFSGCLGTLHLPTLPEYQEQLFIRIGLLSVVLRYFPFRRDQESSPGKINNIALEEIQRIEGSWRGRRNRYLAELNVEEFTESST